MATIHTQLIAEGLEVREEYGARTYFKEVHLVSGLTANHEGVLAEALNQPGLPTYGAWPLNSTSSNLRLVRRSARIFPDDNTKVYVDCEYVGQQDAGFGFIMKAKTGQQTAESNTDLFGFPVKVAYQYPNPYEKDPTRSGYYDQVSASFQYHEPTLELEADGIIRTENPTLWAARWLGRLNNSYWQNGPRGWWMCIVADPTPIDLNASPPRYAFHFEFVLRINGWQPEVAYQTPEGEYPPNLVQGVGIKRVVKYQYREFKEVFPDV